MLIRKASCVSSSRPLKQTAHARVIRGAAAVAHLVEVCNRHDKALGQMIVSPEQGQPLLDQGFRTLAYGDIWTYESALKSGLDSLRS